MTELGMYPDLPRREITPDRVRRVLGGMAEFSPGLDLRKHEPALRWLLVTAERVQRETMEEWLRRHSPEGSAWRPHRNMKKHPNPDPAPDWDYGMTDAEIDETYFGKGRRWKDYWREEWGLKRGEHKRLLRDDSGIPDAPPGAIYILVGIWYRRVLGKKVFRPMFNYKERRNPKTGKPEPDPETVRTKNEAAHLFFLVASAIDSHYTMDRCRRVDRNYYSQLKKSN